MYLAMKMVERVEVSVLHQGMDLPLKFAKGMVGAMPVFETEKAAMNYVGKNGTVIEVCIEKTSKKSKKSKASKTGKNS